MYMYCKWPLATHLKSPMSHGSVLTKTFNSNEQGNPHFKNYSMDLLCLAIVKLSVGQGSSARESLSLCRCQKECTSWNARSYLIDLWASAVASVSSPSFMRRTGGDVASCCLGYWGSSASLPPSGGVRLITIILFPISGLCWAVASLAAVSCTHYQLLTKCCMMPTALRRLF